MIKQINIYSCEDCSKIEAIIDEFDIWSDPVIGLPDGWNCVSFKNKENPNLNSKIVCPECFEKNKGIYKLI